MRDAVETVIFGTETRGGNLFDVALLITILASVTVVMLDSMDVYHAVYGDPFRILEISFTLVFTVEYLVRLWCLRNPVAYAISFCLLYTSPSPRDSRVSRMPSSA